MTTEDSTPEEETGWSMRSDDSGELGDEFAMSDAAYVLGALSPHERRELENHLKGCAACTKAVAELAGLPGLLSRVTVEQLTEESTTLPETLLPSLARAARREGRGRMLIVGAVAATAASLIALGAAALAGPSSSTPPPSASSSRAASDTAELALAAVVPSPVTATARLVDMTWGTRIDVTCAYEANGKYPAEGRPYALVVIDRSGVAQQVATWQALPDRRLTVMGASSLSRQDIATVEIRTMSGRALLRLST
jgi:hypothetical protein